MIGLRAGVDWIKAGLALSKAKKQFERDEKMGYDWTKSVKAGVTQILTLILTASVTAVLGVLSDNEAIKGALAKADVNDAYAGAILLVIGGAARFLQNAWKHNKPGGGIPGVVVLLALLPAFASAQEAAPTPDDFLTYVKSHASIVSGVEIAGEKAEFVSLAIDDDFSLGSQFRGFASLSLFSRQRAAQPEIPTTIEGLSLYSAGEIQGGVYRVLNSRLAIECRAGMTFAMTGLTGKVGDPVDGSKFLGGCGPRISGPAGRLSILLGHHGPVTEGAKWFGFVPSTMFVGEFVLPANMALVVDIAAGRNLQTDSAVTSSRFAVRKRF